MKLNRRQMLAAWGGGTLALLAGGAGMTWRQVFRTKSEIEKLANPFGDPWGSRSAPNPSIPLATSSLLHIYLREPYKKFARFDDKFNLQMPRAFVRYMRNASSPYHYDETIAQLSPQMLLFRKVREVFEREGVMKTFIGYTTVNFAESSVMPGYEEADERFFIHKRGMPPTRENRVQHQEFGEMDTAGDVFDIRNPEFHTYISEKLVDAMVANNVDIVLVDYAASQYVYGAKWQHLFPEGWAKQFEEHQYALLSTLTQHANSRGKRIFCNGMTLDGIYVTQRAKARLYLDACNGICWEQPFRLEWRDEAQDPEAYYKLLDDFFSLATELNKPILVKQGTYRMIGDENAAPGWNWRFKKTSAERERQYVNYFLPFYLLYMQGDLTPLMYTHPTEMSDVFASEAYFQEFDQDVGTPLGLRQRLADHVHYRHFTKAVVVLNNRDEPFEGDVPESPNSSKTVKVSLEKLSGKILGI